MFYDVLRGLVAVVHEVAPVLTAQWARARRDLIALADAGRLT